MTSSSSAGFSDQQMAQLAAMFESKTASAVNDAVEKSHAKFISTFNELVDTKLATVISPLHNEIHELRNQFGVLRNEVDLYKGTSRDIPVPSSAGSSPPPCSCSWSRR